MIEPSPRQVHGTDVVALRRGSSEPRYRVSEDSPRCVFPSSWMVLKDVFFWRGEEPTEPGSRPPSGRAPRSHCDLHTFIVLFYQRHFTTPSPIITILTTITTILATCYHHHQHSTTTTTIMPTLPRPGSLLPLYPSCCWRVPLLGSALPLALTFSHIFFYPGSIRVCVSLSL